MTHRPAVAHIRAPGRLKLLPLVLVLVVAAPAAPAGTQSVDPAGGNHNATVALQLHDLVLTEGELTATMWMFSPEASIHTLDGTVTGADGFHRFANELRTGFPDLVVTVGSINVRDSLVTVRWTMTGQHRGVYRSMPASYAIVMVDGMTTLRFSDDRITEAWLVFDHVAVTDRIAGAYHHLP